MLDCWFYFKISNTKKRGIKIWDSETGLHLGTPHWRFYSILNSFLHPTVHNFFSFKSFPSSVRAASRVEIAGSPRSDIMWGPLRKGLYSKFFLRQNHEIPLIEIPGKEQGIFLSPGSPNKLHTRLRDIIRPWAGKALTDEKKKEGWVG